LSYLFYVHPESPIRDIIECGPFYKEAPMPRMFDIKMTVYGKDGSESELTLPSRRVVCPRCDGEGKHVNPAVDGDGISAEEFEADPDFEENYMNGVYDVKCEKCKGNKVIDEVDFEKCSPEQQRALKEHYALEREAEMEAYHERRWNC
jgi:hypothetical protein